MGGAEPADKQRVLIWAPYGRDAPLLQKELLGAGIGVEICNSVESLVELLRDGAGAALIADEALRPETVNTLAAELKQQPAWSDFPLVIMTSGGETTNASRYRLRMLEPLGNISLLERPLRVATLVSTLRAVLRARKHQYEVAALLQEKTAIERQIHQRNDELMKANRELEEFAYVSSHDLQEPLRMINIYTQLLIRQCGYGNPESEQFARFINKGVERMEILLRDLLAFSRVIHADFPTVDDADLSAALSNAVEMLGIRIEESGAQIESTPLPRVRGDETQFTLLFQNLLSNALKYSRKGVTPRIRVSAELSGEEWVIAVRDNGIGFDPQYAERIFGLFKRLHKDEIPGTGLGLAICRRIMERCEGRIWAEGKLQEGATFYFAVPVGAGPQQAVTKPEPSPAKRAVESNSA